ncbi:MAG: 50S ribosomal protein L32 [Ornithinimicrobium sp.]|uniref:50S ribosomal protein L32 n=1 Tax=Ornithinimicrobium sp. TaxID=1977084 RepID=UPI0017A9059C|nr:50S ribosomal protein L32 [Actinomycetota bacterium]
MAVPKRKMSRSNTRHRRSNWKAEAVATTACPQCQAQTQPHRACPSCGTYGGRHYDAAERTAHQD